MLKREISEKLISWKNQKKKKALCIIGARQIGKTTIIREFAKEQYEHFVEINFILDKGAEKIFELFKPLIQKKDAKLVKTLETEFKNVNGLLDKHMIDEKNYKSYTDLSEADTKVLADAVTKLCEPLSQMCVILDVKYEKCLIKNF